MAPTNRSDEPGRSGRALFHREAVKGLHIVAKPELGSKRQCESCGAKFFDLNRDPITCPRCGAVYQRALLASSRMRPADAEDAEEPKLGPEIVSLEEADDDTDGKIAVVVPDDVDVDVDVDLGDDDVADDDTFLEDDDDSGDVSDLIDGEIEKDDEH